MSGLQFRLNAIAFAKRMGFAWRQFRDTFCELFSPGQSMSTLCVGLGVDSARWHFFGIVRSR